MSRFRDTRLVSVNETAKTPHFSPHRKSCSVRFSTLREKPSEKMIMIVIIIGMNKSQESTVFGGRQKLTSTMKQRPEKKW